VGGAEAETRPASAGLRFLAIVAALSPAPAAAGAWIAPEDGQEIWTNVAGQRDDDVSFFETSAYYEIPVNERVAVVGAPYFEQAIDAGDQGWRAEASLAVKAVVLRDERSVMALQAGVLWTSWPDFGCSEGGVELRWLGGRSFGRTGFLNLEVGERAFEGGGCGGERLDLTAGFHPWDNWLAMGQVFLDAPRGGSDTVKVQFTLVRLGNEGKGLQFGLRGRVDDGLSEPAIVIGFWGRPGE
jgi:hypothetical protein